MQNLQGWFNNFNLAFDNEIHSHVANMDGKMGRIHTVNVGLIWARKWNLFLQSNGAIMDNKMGPICTIE